MIDWLKSIIKGQKHCCWECQCFISNEAMNNLYLNNHTYCEGGGFCVPIKNVPYFIGRGTHDVFCTKFKFRKVMKNRKEHFHGF